MLMNFENRSESSRFRAETTELALMFGLIRHVHLQIRARYRPERHYMRGAGPASEHKRREASTTCSTVATNAAASPLDPSAAADVDAGAEQPR